MCVNVCMLALCCSYSKYSRYSLCLGDFALFLIIFTARICCLCQTNLLCVTAQFLPGETPPFLNFNLCLSLCLSRWCARNVTAYQCDDATWTPVFHCFRETTSLLLFKLPFTDMQFSFYSVITLTFMEGAKSII